MPLEGLLVETMWVLTRMGFQAPEYTLELTRELLPRSGPDGRAVFGADPPSSLGSLRGDAAMAVLAPTVRLREKPGGVGPWERSRASRRSWRKRSPRSSRPCGSTSPDYGRTTWRAVALPLRKMVQGGMELRACGRPKRADSDGAGGDGPRPPEGDEAALTRREGITHGPLGNPDQGSQESPPLPPAPDYPPPDANAWRRARALFNRGKGSAGSALATL